MKADLHIHSKFSPNSFAKPESMMTAAAEHGLDYIAVTDKQPTESWNYFKSIEKDYPVNVILGQEIDVSVDGHKGGSVLGLFLNKPIEGNDINSIIKQVNNQGGLLGIAHPFSERQGEFTAFHEIEDWANLAIEIRNGRVTQDRDNEMAFNLASKTNAPFVAGSDAHTPFEVGSVYLNFDGKSESDLKKAILNRDVFVSGRNMHPLFSYLAAVSWLSMVF